MLNILTHNPIYILNTLNQICIVIKVKCAILNSLRKAPDSAHFIQLTFKYDRHWTPLHMLLFSLLFYVCNLLFR